MNAAVVRVFDATVTGANGADRDTENDERNARIEHDRALARVMSGVIRDDTQLFKFFSDNESFRRSLSDMIFAATYQRPEPDAT